MKLRPIPSSDGGTGPQKDFCGWIALVDGVCNYDIGSVNHYSHHNLRKNAENCGKKDCLCAQPVDIETNLLNTEFFSNQEMYPTSPIVSSSLRRSNFSTSAIMSMGCEGSAKSIMRARSWTSDWGTSPWKRGDLSTGTAGFTRCVAGRRRVAWCRDQYSFAQTP
jgi:hypothetical protein